jgi:thiamine pyrophosphate-dependent acetolactate synthase large subunit-like protein
MPAVTDVSELASDGFVGRVVVLAGPGVIDDGAVSGLREAAAAGDLGVANTWGAKGVFAWDSPHHLGTCGLQARDFELLGFGRVDAIVTTGLSEDEAPQQRWALAPTVDVVPRELAALAGRVRATSAPPNDLYPRLAAVAQPGYADSKVPLHPARAVADLGAVLPAGGLVVAEPGIAGLWVARTFPTPAISPGEERRVVVPSRRAAGAAAGLALTAARDGRPAIFVTATEPDDATREMIDVAEAERLPLVVVVWSATGRLRDVDDHTTRVRQALANPGPIRVDVPVALDDTQLLIEAAGDVVAWGGLDASELGSR